MSIGARHTVSKTHTNTTAPEQAELVTAALRCWDSSILKWVTLREKTNRNRREGVGVRAVLLCVESGVV